MKKHSFVLLLVSTLIGTAFPQINPFPTEIIIVEAHGGRTDSSGGHKDNKNKSGLGSYHYHCDGNPAHLHNDGICEYSSSAKAESTATTTESTATTASGENSVETIKQVQQALNDKGYDCGIADGIMGEKTKNAIEKFQKDNELTIDGIIGKQVKDALGIS